MKITTGILTFFLMFSKPCVAQRNATANLPSTKIVPQMESSTETYVVFGATPSQEVVLRSQILSMQPEVLPLRIFFVPHWKYLDAARTFHLHVPSGYGSLMFTHLPSRTIFIDNGRYVDGGWLGHWIAHELGHLATNSAREDDAERAAKEFRSRLKDSAAERPV